MSASNNFESVANQGEFKNRVPPSKPMMAKGHAPGVKAGNDAAPEFHAQQLPPGAAPSDRTFRPNTIHESPAQAENADVATEARTFASDTINGFSSSDVHQGLGMPVQGQSSSQVRGSGLTKGAKEGNGLMGVGADPRDPVRERGLDKEVPKGTRGKSGENREDIPGAEEREPVGAEQVAAERA